MIISNARVLTFDTANRVLDAGSVEIRADGTIGAVLPRPKAGRGPAPLDAQGKLLMPALINWMPPRNRTATMMEA